LRLTPKGQGVLRALTVDHHEELRTGSHGLRIHQDSETDLHLRVEEIMVEEIRDRTPPTIAASTSVGELAERIARRDPEVSRHPALPVVDDHGNLESIITRGDILRAFEREPGRGSPGSRVRASQTGWSRIPTNSSPKRPARFSVTTLDASP
jgi:CBS-domain-containing membrane protein